MAVASSSRNFGNYEKLNKNLSKKQKQQLHALAKAGCKNEVLNKYKLDLYNDNLGLVKQYNFCDSFCHHFVMYGKCSFWQQGKCFKDHIWSTLDWLGTKANRERALFLCKYLIYVIEKGYDAEQQVRANHQSGSLMTLYCRCAECVVSFSYVESDNCAFTKKEIKLCQSYYLRALAKNDVQEHSKRRMFVVHRYGTFCEFVLKDLKLAEQHYRQCTIDFKDVSNGSNSNGNSSISSTNAKHWFNYAMCVRKQKRYAECVDLFENALKRDENDVNILYEFGLTLNQLGAANYPRASQMLQKCQKLMKHGKVKVLNNYKQDTLNRVLKEMKDAIKHNKVQKNNRTVSLNINRNTNKSGVSFKNTLASAAKKGKNNAPNVSNVSNIQNLKNAANVVKNVSNASNVPNVPYMARKDANNSNAATPKMQDVQVRNAEKSESKESAWTWARDTSKNNVTTPSPIPYMAPLPKPSTPSMASMASLPSLPSMASAASDANNPNTANIAHNASNAINAINANNNACTPNNVMNAGSGGGANKRAIPKLELVDSIRSKIEEIDENDENEMRSARSVVTAEKSVKSVRSVASVASVASECSGDDKLLTSFGMEEEASDALEMKVIEVKEYNSFILSNDANDCVEYEFTRFWSKLARSREMMNNQRESAMYFENFKEKKLNKIIVVPWIDHTILWKQIGIKNEKYIKRFTCLKRELIETNCRFAYWLRKLGVYEKYYSTLSKYGIITFESFEFHIKRNKCVFKTLLVKNEPNQTWDDNDIHRLFGELPNPLH